MSVDIKSPQLAAGSDSAYDSNAGSLPQEADVERTSLNEHQLPPPDSTDPAVAEECRICRSSAMELLEAERSSCGRCCKLTCSQQRRSPPLHRLGCACTGSVRHVCARCYRRYYVARGLTACEICRQPTGLEGEIDGRSARCCKQLVSVACSDNARFLIYGLFLVIAFVSIFVLFFVISSAAKIRPPTTSSPLQPTPTPPTNPPPHRLERDIFIIFAAVNLAVALGYIGYSCWKQNRLSDRFCRRYRRQTDTTNDANDDNETEDEAATRTRRIPTLTGPAILPNVPLIGAIITVAIPQQPPLR